MGDEKGFVMWETIFSMILLSLLLLVTPSFLEVVEGGIKKRGMEHSAHQLAQTILEGWKNGEPLYFGEKRGGDGRIFYVDVNVSLLKESTCVERCQLTIRRQGIHIDEEVCTISAYRYVETEGFDE